MLFKNDDKVEEILESHDVGWEIVEIRFCEIDIAESRRNGARQGSPIQPRTVSLYGENMDAGHVFPMIAVSKIPTGYLIHAGNQRSESIRQKVLAGVLPKDTLISVYLVCPDNKMAIHDLERRTNIGNGWNESQEGILANVLYMIKEDGMSVKDAAAAYGMSVSRVQTAKRAKEKRLAWARAGVNTSQLSQSSILAVASAGDAESEIKLARIASLSSAGASLIKPVAGLLRNAANSSARIGILKEAADAWKLDKQGKRSLAESGKVRRPRKTTLIRSLDKLADFLDSGKGGKKIQSWSDVQISNQGDKDTVEALWSRVSLGMQRAMK